jgi:Holliday junction resolvasome RuvABC endonuclease subunit
MVILGIDPGSRECGWALLDCEPKRRAVVIDCGKIEPGAFSQVQTLAPIALVCIEWPADMTMRRGSSRGRMYSMGKELAATSLVAGELAGRFSAALPVVKLRAKDARKLVCGSQNATDKDVSYWCALLCEMPKRSNDHERDAMIVALAGYRKWQADQLETQRAGAQAVLEEIVG